MASDADARHLKAHAVVETQSDTCETLLGSALAALKEGDLDTAEGLLTRLLVADARNADALHFLGVVNHRQGKAALAEQWIRGALLRDPQNVSAHVNLGNVLLERGSKREASAAFRAALAIAPDCAQAWSNLGTCHHSLDDLVEAVDAWQRAVRINPHDPDAWYGLSFALIKRDQVQEGLAAYRRAVGLRPAHLLAREEVIRLLAVRDRRDDAARLYREWLVDDPQAAKACQRLAVSQDHEAPSRASDAYVETLFDRFAESFDSTLAALEYRAPHLIAGSLAARIPAEAALAVADLGCGTGLCGPLLRPWAHTLVGCDLSNEMLVRARHRRCYDELLKFELQGFLLVRPDSFDVVVSADTLCYFGALEGIFAAVRGALRGPGWFVFTVESLPADDAPWKLQSTGRYAHGRRYLMDALESAGLCVEIEAATLRLQSEKPVAGWLVTAGINGHPLR